MVPLTRILLVRHGETDWNRDGRVMGTRSVPLNEQGERQACRLATFLQTLSVHAIYSSPVLRAHQTASILAQAALHPVQIDPGLTEFGMGDWEGRYWKDLSADVNRHNLYLLPDEARPPGGETLREVQARSVGTVERARSRPESTLLFVTHADVVRAIVAHYLNFELRRIRQIRIDHASVTALDLASDGLAHLLYLNVVPTLDPSDGGMR